MIMDVMLREGFNELGKAIYFVYRVHDSKLREFLWKAQDEECYIVTVICLFMKGEGRVTDPHNGHVHDPYGPPALNPFGSLGVGMVDSYGGR